MHKLMTAAVVGGATLAVGVLPAIGLAAATTMPLSHGPAAAPGIIGGQNVTSAPWAAQVSWDGTGFECSGTVIAPQWVLTAAHCVNPGGDNPGGGPSGDPSGGAPSAGGPSGSGGMTVLIGSTKLGKGTAATVDQQQTDPKADLALLHLAAPVQTKSMALADKDPAVGDTNEIYGWGKTSTKSGPAPQLKTAKVQVTSTEGCQDAAGGPAICSKAVTGTAFNGDSGGPELADGVEVGVCSTGDEQARTQQYASVAANRDWIKQVAKV
jgi:secreted trypsin-like serine protease